jgi:hypothetical protein
MIYDVALRGTIDLEAFTALTVCRRSPITNKKGEAETSP